MRELIAHHALGVPSRSPERGHGVIVPPVSWFKPANVPHRRLRGQGPVRKDAGDQKEDSMTALTVAFDARLPHARWGPLFHVFRLEQPNVTLDWCPVGFPMPGRPLLEHADVGVFLEPPREDHLCGLTIDSSPMVVVMAVGHRLAHHHELTVADVLHEPFPGGPNLHPEWSAFWTLDKQRGVLPMRTDDDVRSAEQGLEVVASGRAIATVADWAASGLEHPGVVALPLGDGPRVATRLIWRSEDNSPAVRYLVELATAWSSDGGGNGAGRSARNP
jgi:DNA-binding transcriptional LysR family regulator